MIWRRHHKGRQHREPGCDGRQARLGPPLTNFKAAVVRHATRRKPVRAPFLEKLVATNCPHSIPHRPTALVGLDSRDRRVALPLEAWRLCGQESFQDDVRRLHGRGPSRSLARPRLGDEVRCVPPIDPIDRVEHRGVSDCGDSPGILRGCGGCRQCAGQDLVPVRHLIGHGYRRSEHSRVPERRWPRLSRVGKTIQSYCSSYGSSISPFSGCSVGSGVRGRQIRSCLGTHRLTPMYADPSARRSRDATEAELSRRALGLAVDGARLHQLRARAVGVVEVELAPAVCPTRGSRGRG